MTGKRSTIAVDVDDVLAITVPRFIDFTRDKWGTVLSEEDYSENWMKTWNIGSEELIARTEIIRKEFWHILEHYTDAVPVLNELSKRYELVITTSRRREVSKETKDWIDKYFPGIFREIHHAGIYDVDKSEVEVYEKATRATKARLCKEIGADYLIDDHPKHCIGADAVGVKAILFGDYHWNKYEEIPKTIVRLRDWQEVGKYFAAR